MTANGGGRRGAARMHEEGQVLPVLLVFLVTLLTGGVMMFRIGSAAALRADAATAADAAALASVEDIKRQLTEHYLDGADAGFTVDEASARAQADYFARQNGARLISYDQIGLDVLVTVETVEGVDGDGPGAGAGDTHAVVRSRARLRVSYQQALPPLSGSAGAELQELAEAAGLESIPENSALRRYTGNGGCSGGIDVMHLARELKIAILEAESVIGPLVINSGYRTVECQAILQDTVTGLVAAPGRSMHNYGLAIDVANHVALARVASGVGLCQPFPAEDAVHFALATSAECGGRTGPLGPAGPFGGDVGSYVDLETTLVNLDGS